MNKKLSLGAIEILKSEFNKPSILPPSGSQFNLDSKFELKFNIEKELVHSISSITVRQANADIVFGSLKTNCIFTLKDLKSFSRLENGKLIIELPREIHEVIFRESLATTRGIMFSEFKGTFIQSIHLPLYSSTEELPNFTKKV